MAVSETKRLHLHAKFHLNVFIVSASGGQKPQFWTNFDFWRFLHRPPFTDDGEICFAIADPQCTFMCQNSSRSVYSAPSGGENPPIFAVFWTSAFSEKVEHGYTTTNLPLSNGIKIISVLQRLHGKIGCTISDVQKRDGQNAWRTDKKLNVFRRPAGGCNPIPTKLGTVTEDLEHFLAPLKCLGAWCIVSPLGGTENLGVNRPVKLKPHNSITPWANPTKL